MKNLEEKSIEKIEILEKNKIKNTPFWVVKTNESENYYLVCANTRMETECKTIEEAEEKYKKPTYESISFLVEAIINELKIK